MRCDMTMTRPSYFVMVDSAGAAIPLSELAIPLSADMDPEVSAGAGVLSSAFLPQLITANATVIERMTIIARAKSLRMFFKFTSSQSRRTGDFPAAAIHFLRIAS